MPLVYAHDADVVCVHCVTVTSASWRQFGSWNTLITLWIINDCVVTFCPEATFKLRLNENFVNQTVIYCRRRCVWFCAERCVPQVTSTCTMPVFVFIGSMKVKLEISMVFEWEGAGDGDTWVACVNWQNTVLKDTVFKLVKVKQT
jgi:hypothetical protein